MRWIKIIFKPVIWFYNHMTVIDPNHKRNINCSANDKNETKINPATGLYMIGGLDSMGNSFGSSASDRNNNYHNDYHRQNSTSSSSYDPFTNRY